MIAETLFDWRASRDAAMTTIERNAGEIFREQATAFVTSYLMDHGPTPGETITDACKAAGIRAHDDRAMGPVYMSLARRGVIEKCGTAIRKRGHGTAGGNVWRIKP